MAGTASDLIVHHEMLTVERLAEGAGCSCGSEFIQFISSLCVDVQRSEAIGSVRPRRSPEAAVPASALIRRYRWVQRQLTAHNVPFMPLPSSPPTSTDFCATSERFIESISHASAPHVAVSISAQPSRPDSQRSGDGGRERPEPAAALAAGACPVLWQHTRLNMLLPATASTAVAVCALAAAAGGVAPTAAQPAQAPEVVSMALWLRGLLAPDLNAALGIETFTSQSQVRLQPRCRDMDIKAFPH